MNGGGILAQNIYKRRGYRSREIPEAACARWRALVPIVLLCALINSSKICMDSVYPRLKVQTPLR